MIRNLLGLIPRRFRTRTASGSPADAIIHQPTLHSTSIHHPVVIPPTHEKNTVRELGRHIGHLFETCKNRAVFASDELWQTRARACVEATTSLVCYADAELGWFGDILGTLGDIGNFEGIRNLVLSGRDRPFVVRWTCLSIMAFRDILRSNLAFKEQARLAVGSWLGDGADEAEEKNAWKIDQTLEDRWESLSRNDVDRLSAILKLIRRLDGMDSLDSKAAILNEAIEKASQRITRQLPGVYFDFPDLKQDLEPFFRQALELVRDPLNLRFTSCRQPKKIITFLSHVESAWSKGGQTGNQTIMSVLWPKKFLQRTLWSLQDFRDGGGLGVAVEVFLLAFKELLSSSPSQESYSALCIGTFRAITTDWRRYKHSRGTQKLLLDVVAFDQGILRTCNYPDYITNELWELLGNMLEGETGPHIDSAVKQLTDHQREDGGRYGAKALAVISRLRASCLQGPDIATA